MLVLSLMLLLCAPIFIDLIAHDSPQARGGSISYRDWGPLTAPVELSGEWQFIWLGGDGSNVLPGTHRLADVPGPWGGLAIPKHRLLPSFGTASYRLTIRDLPRGRYTLHIPITFAADRVFIDGRQIEGHGQVALDSANTRYDLRSHEITFEAGGPPLSLRIDLAAYLHRDNGLAGAPVFGEASAMRRWIALEWLKDLLFHSALLLLILNGFMAYLQRQHDHAPLYLALAALCLLPGSAVLSYDNLLLLALPDLGFTAMLALLYIPTAAAVGFFLVYSRALFPREMPQLLFSGLLALVGAFLFAQCFAFSALDTMEASRIAIVWPAVLGMTLIGIMGVVLRAAFRGRDGAPVFLVGLGLFSLLSVNATLAWSSVVPGRYLLRTTSLPLGMLMLLLSHLVVLAERWSLSILAAARINTDLRELVEVSSAITSKIELEGLLKQITETTSRLLNAERSSLLLYDGRTDELWSLVAEGLSTHKIRIRSDVGLAGHAYSHGEIINIEDAYVDQRFDRTFDLLTGYTTRSIVTMPVVARDGRRLGVMQTLNRKDGMPFSEEDVKRMVAFAAQAAIAIDNATLFSDVVKSRNYNENILRSMSSGVITLDRDARIGKLNAAAASMLKLPVDALERTDARALPAMANQQLIAEMDIVNRTGKGKQLIDIDLAVDLANAISANVNIVPLLGENGPGGLLLLIEDISEGKRMRRAMRRFMAQKIIDQVLSRGDELLFGTACRACVLFADIRNFTSMAELLAPRQTVEMLNEVFTEFVEAVTASDGVLDKFIGDAIMAVYGVPIPTGRDPENAVESAVQMLRALRLLNQRRSRSSLPLLGLGIGIATGDVIAGTIGSPKRMDYTVIGDCVNLSSRLQSLTKDYGVEMLVDERTAEAVAGRHPLRELDLITVRGRLTPTRVFQVLSDDEGDGTDVVAMMNDYRHGRVCLLARDWSGAATAFASALVWRPNDRASRIMLDRANTLAANPPTGDWNGAWDTLEKSVATPLTRDRRN